MAAWLPQPVMFHSSREFNCDMNGFTPDQCQYYMNRWHFWYIADYVYALPTVAFFMCTIGIFIISYALTQLLTTSSKTAPSIWRRGVAATRYLSYRGFHVKSLGWSSAPIGVLILGAIGTIFFFCMDLAPSPYYWPGPDTTWGGSPPLGTRSGWMALACMPFLFATASKANWITLVTGVTHEKLQVFHRWIAYAFFILALMHTFPFIVWHIRNHDMVNEVTVSSTLFYWTGIVALIFQAWLTFASWGPIRNLGYEFFKAAHFLAAVVFMVVFFWHCAGTLTSWDYFVATAAVYVPCYAYPWFKTVFEYGIGQRAQVCVEECGFIKVTVPVNFVWQPGQHCFLRFRSFGLHVLSAHPFTICSLPSISPDKKSEITFYIRHRRGFTARLYSRAMQHPRLLTPVLVDGPYGGIDNQKYFDSDRLVVVAGGSGAGWILPFIEQFLRYCSTAVSEDHESVDKEEKEANSQPLIRRRRLHGPQSLRVVLATRDIASRTWFHTAFTDLLLSYYSSSTHPDIKVEVHLTGDAERIIQSPARSEKDLERSDSSSSGGSPKDQHAAETRRLSAMHVPDEEVRGRPNLPSIIREEASVAESRNGQNLGVFVCGPLSMQDDVRNAVAKENLDIVKSSRPGGVYLHLEHFSWA